MSNIDKATKSLISAPIIDLKAIIQKLTIDDYTKSIVKEKCEIQKFTFPNTDIVELLRKDWVNDVVTYPRDSLEFKKATTNPSEHFQIWVDTRIRNPFKVSQRIINKYSKKYGFEFVSVFEKIRWVQEVAWANKFQSHFNDDYCIFAGLFLKSTKKNVNKTFSDCIELAYDLSISSKYLSDVHELTAHEILTYDLSKLNWDPIFLIYSHKNFSNIVDGMADSRKSLIAQKTREDFSKESMEQVRTDAKFNTTLSNRLLVAMKALNIGLTSNQLVACEKVFMAQLNDNKIKINESQSIDQRFLSWVRNQESFDIKPPTLEQINERKHVLSTINQNWINNLSDDIKELGGENRRTFSEWRDSVLSDRREAPEDPVVDYLFYLIKEH